MSSADPMTPAARLVRERLADLEPESLEIFDDSAEHAGHAGNPGGGGHLSLVIVSNRFVSMSRLQRHQAVYSRVADLIPAPIHALSIRTFAPDEFHQPSIG